MDNDLASDPKLGERNLAQFGDGDKYHDGGDDWKIDCPMGGSGHLSLNVVTNKIQDFSGHNWNDVARGLLRKGVLPNYYVAEYVYTDELGKKLYVHGKRRPKEPGKPNDWTHAYKHGSNGVPVKLKGDESKKQLKETRRVLFDLPLLSKTPKIWIAAGEKDAELLRHRFSKNATTRPFGEQHWDDGYFQQLDHATSITIVIDNDDAGYRGGWTVYSKLVNKQVKLRVFRPQDSVKDFFDHVNHGFGLQDLVPVDIKELEERGSKPKAKSTLEHLSQQLDLKDIDVTDDSVAIKNIAEAINGGTFPELYQQGGVVFRVQGDPATGPLTAAECTPADLRALLSEYTFTYKYMASKNGAGSQTQKPALPSESLCRAVLRYGKWRIPMLELNPGRYEIRTPEGTLNLLTGTLRESTFADMHTCQTKVNYAPELGTNCPQFLATLRQQLSSEADVQCALDGLAYALTGDTSWQMFYWWQGIPGSGKSTVALTLHEMLGSYSTIADDDLLFGSRETHPANIIRLEGKRLVIQDEIPERRQLKIERLRQHTTLPTIPGRGMGQNFRDVFVSWKLLFTSNPKARIVSQGKDGIWRRMVLLHCESAIPKAERKKFFHRTLFREEGSQILNLLLERIPRIRESGPKLSKNVEQEVAAYEEETDLTGQFMSLIERREGAWLSNEDLNAACESWSPKGQPIMSPVQLGLAMREAKFVPSAIVKCKRVRPDGEQVRPAKARSVRGWIGAAIPEGVISFDSRWVPMNPAAVKPRH